MLPAIFLSCSRSYYHPSALTIHAHIFPQYYSVHANRQRYRSAEIEQLPLLFQPVTEFFLNGKLPTLPYLSIHAAYFPHNTVVCTPIANGTGLLSCQDNTTTKAVPNDTANPFKCLSGFALTLGSGPSQSDSCARMWLATGARRHTRMRLDMQHAIRPRSKTALSLSR